MYFEINESLETLIHMHVQEQSLLIYLPRPEIKRFILMLMLVVQGDLHNTPPPVKATRETCSELD